MKMLLRIPHKLARRAIPGQWIVSDNWIVMDCSLLWLFCWCKNGLNSSAARKEAIHVWDSILPVLFREFEPTINHEMARKYRYLRSTLLNQPKEQKAEEPNMNQSID